MGNEAGTELEGCAAAGGCGRDGDRHREGPSGYGGVAVLGLPEDWDSTCTSPEQFSSF